MKSFSAKERANQTKEVVLHVYEDPEIPLREAVYRTLRKAILTGELAPNERLTEVRLGKMLGTSRTPIREAIRKLELEGLVVLVPRSGAKVASISEKELRDVLEVRRTLDELCARLASERIDDGHKERLAASVAEFEEIVSSGDKTAIARADVEFHDIIAEAAANRRLLQILNELADQIYRYRFEYIKDDQSYQLLIREHRAIAEAICDGNAAAAVAAAREHIDHQESAILKSLRTK